MLLSQPKIIKLIHKGKARANVIDICLVLVKIYGNNPKKLLIKINENKEININVLPLIFELTKILNSLWRVEEIKIHNILNRDGIIQYIGVKNIKINKALNQFKLKEKILDGSKDENKFAIIFKKF